MISSFSEQQNGSAERLKERLLTQYQGKSLEEIFNGEDFLTKGGRCYRLSTRRKISLLSFSPDKTKRALLSHLRLIYGVGYKTERALKKKGYRTIKDLTRHPFYASEAHKFLQTLDQGDPGRVIAWVERWFSKSHPLLLYAFDLSKREDFIFLDIETMGLYDQPIILLGLGQIEDDELLITQYLLRDISEETGALSAFVSHVEGRGVWVTFNGRMFDVPYINDRLSYHGIRANLKKPNFDLLYFSRRAWRWKLPNCKLGTLEKYLLGVEREDDVPSALVPDFYSTYLRTKNVGPLVPIIEHNRQDIVSLIGLFSELCREWGNFRF